MEQGTVIDLHYLSPQEGKIIDVGTSVCTGASKCPPDTCTAMGSSPTFGCNKKDRHASNNTNISFASFDNATRYHSALHSCRIRSTFLFDDPISVGILLEMLFVFPQVLFPSSQHMLHMDGTNLTPKKATVVLLG